MLVVAASSSASIWGAIVPHVSSGERILRAQRLICSGLSRRGPRRTAQATLQKGSSANTGDSRQRAQRQSAASCGRRADKRALPASRCTFVAQPDTDSQKSPLQFCSSLRHRASCFADAFILALVVSNERNNAYKARRYASSSPACLRGGPSALTLTHVRTRSVISARARSALTRGRLGGATHVLRTLRAHT